MIEDKASATYKHENPIVRWYFNKKMDLVIKLGLNLVVISARNELMISNQMFG